MSDENYDRNEVLKAKLNEFLSTFTKEKKDYFEKLSQEQLLGLKRALAYINNYLTLKTTLAMTRWIIDFFKLTEDKGKELIDKIKKIKPNANGYDIRFEDDDIKLIVEIKSTIPINNGNKFGSAQRNSILDDAIKLQSGKGVLSDTKKYLKFIGIIDTGDQTANAIEGLLTQPQRPWKGKEIREKRYDIIGFLEKIKFDAEPSDLTTEKIYVKKVKID